MKAILKLLLPVGIVGMLIISSCKDPVIPIEYPHVANYTNESIYKWNELFLQIERYAKGYRPGPAPRALGYMGLSAYEACAPGMVEYKSIASRYIGLDLPTLKQDKSIYWPEVVNASYAYLMRRFFEKTSFTDGITNQNMIDRINSLENELEAKYLQLSNEVNLNNSKAWGQDVARAVWAWSATDVYGHEAYLNPQPIDYTPPVGDGLWVQTQPGDGGRAMFPRWGNVRLLGTKTIQDLKVKPPYWTNNSDPNSVIYNQAKEVIALNQETKDHPQEEFAHIAQFWSDDRVGMTFSPPSRLLAIADQLYLLEQVNLETAVAVNAQLGLALNDASVACWYNKYVYNVERPVTYINRNIDPNWTVGWLGFTPAFPAYPSGHSTFGGTGSRILANAFIDNTQFTDRCHEGRTDFLGAPRTYGLITKSGIENALSRIPLGVHFRMDCDTGLDLGEKVAQSILDLDWTK